MRLLWFVSDAIHRDALDAALCDAHLSNDKKHHRRRQELLVPPTCDCIEMSIDTLDEMLLAAHADEANTDYLLVREERPKLALFDMDSTLIQQEVIDQLAAACGLGDQGSAITERAMRGELDFIESFTERLGLLSGLTEPELDAVYQRLTLMPGAEILTANLSGAGMRLGVVSGGFSFFADQIGDRLGMDFVVSNKLECRDGQVTGRVIPPIIDGSMKLQTLNTEARALGIDLGETLAVGDGANDIPMLTASGIGVAHNAKPMVCDAANHCLSHHDLSALSYLVKF